MGAQNVLSMRASESAAGACYRQLPSRLRRRIVETGCRVFESLQVRHLLSIGMSAFRTIQRQLNEIQEDGPRVEPVPAVE
jgi:hypothetical protein